MKEIKAIPIMKKWIHCPACGAEQKIIFDNTARCMGVYTKCKKCKVEYEIKIKDGLQE